MRDYPIPESGAERILAKVGIGVGLGVAEMESGSRHTDSPPAKLSTDGGSTSRHGRNDRAAPTPGPPSSASRRGLRPCGREQSSRSRALDGTRPIRTRGAFAAHKTPTPKSRPTAALRCGRPRLHGPRIRSTLLQTVASRLERAGGGPAFFHSPHDAVPPDGGGPDRTKKCGAG